MPTRAVTVEDAKDTNALAAGASLVDSAVFRVRSTRLSLLTTPDWTKGWSKTAWKYSRYRFPVPQKPPLSVKPVNVLVPMVIAPVAGLKPRAASAVSEARWPAG